VAATAVGSRHSRVKAALARAAGRVAHRVKTVETIRLGTRKGQAPDTAWDDLRVALRRKKAKAVKRAGARTSIKATKAVWLENKKMKVPDKVPEDLRAALR